MGYSKFRVATTCAMSLFVFPLALHAAANHESLKCEVYSYGQNISQDNSSKLVIEPLSIRRRVKDGEATLRGSAPDVRPRENGKFFNPEPVPSPIQYEASLVDGNISILATATVGTGDTETFSVSSPESAINDAKFPGVILKATLKSTLEPEVRFDDNKTERFEIQCQHILPRE